MNVYVRSMTYWDTIGGGYDLMGYDRGGGDC